MDDSRKKVLVVDDEEALRDIITEVLDMVNVQSITASTGMEAIEIAEQLDQPIDLMIIDLFMPNMNGKEVYEKLKAFYPNCPVLFISGYESINKKIPSRTNQRFLKKPFTLDQLQKTILELIGVP